MTTILFMVSVAILLSVTFVVGYLWSLSSGQYDDLVTPAMRILSDDRELKEFRKMERISDEDKRTH